MQRKFPIVLYRIRQLKYSLTQWLCQYCCERLICCDRRSGKPSLRVRCVDARDGKTTLNKLCLWGQVKQGCGARRSALCSVCQCISLTRIKLRTLNVSGVPWTSSADIITKREPERDHKYASKSLPLKHDTVWDCHPQCPEERQNEWAWESWEVNISGRESQCVRVWLSEVLNQRELNQTHSLDRWMSRREKTEESEL